MSSVLSSLFFFIVAIGVLVTVHEFGHFWVARRLGVKVLRFSVGFGKPIWSWYRKNDDTEYVIAALPLGGYVKMLDEAEGPVGQQDLHRAFNRKPLASRFAIVSAGPIFNFLLAIVAYWFIFVIGVSGIKPMIGEVVPGSIAEIGGFQRGDLITSIGGKNTKIWNSAIIELLDKSLDKDIISIEVEDADHRKKIRLLDIRQTEGLFERADLLESFGLRPFRPTIPAVIGELQVGGPAARAGIQTGDLIVSADGQTIDDWDAWVVYIRERPEQEIHVEIDRGGGFLELMLTPKRIETENGDIGRIGAGVDFPSEVMKGLRAVEQYSLFSSIGVALIKTWDMTMLTFRMLGKMIVGDVSVKNLSGPISIAQYAGQSASIGVVSFIGFLALISISLGVLNLLPIPLLDGGHLLYYFVEMVKGSPVSEEIQALGQRIGIALLAAVMVLAFYNDFARLFGN